MLVPLALVRGVAQDRQAYFESAVADVASAWGEAQTLTGPLLVIPEVHRRKERGADGAEFLHENVVERVYLPRTLELDVTLDHQLRHRSIYEVPVYLAAIRATGSFRPLTDVETRGATVEQRLEQARLVMGVSQTQSLTHASSVVLAGREVPLQAGTKVKWMDDGFSADLPGIETGQEISFALDFELRGTQEFLFTPLGDDTRVRISSNWPHPSFGGHFLPDRYDITAAGFDAVWNVHELARSLPRSWVADEGLELTKHRASVAVFEPLTQYRTVDRAIKYGLLFVALTFVAFACFELTSAVRFHPVQYGVVGAGLVLFYLTLLSLSEHLPFGTAYAISTAALTGVIGWYVWAMTRQRTLWLWITGILTGLYLTLFVLLSLEAFALLAGTAALLIALIALMYATRSLATSANPAPASAAMLP
jgi:inner membrane protein